MKTIKFEVKKDEKSLGFATCTQFGTVAEAVKHFGETKVLRDINRQVKTDSANKFRTRPKLDELGLTKTQRSSYDAVLATDAKMASDLLKILQNANK